MSKFAPLILILFHATSALTATADSRISQYGHTVWRIQDGHLGGMPWDIAQTRDGYIWVGTDAGLFRFDGVRFVLWKAQYGEQLPPCQITRLLAARDGSLWIGTDIGLAHLANNRLTLYEKGKGWFIQKIFEDKDGKIWVGRVRPDDFIHPLCQVLDTQLKCYGKEEGVDTFGVSALAQDSSGHFWIGGSSSFVRWRPAEAKIYRPTALQSLENTAGVMALLPAKDGSLWVGMAVAGRGAGLQHMVDGVLKPFVSSKLDGQTLEVTHLWNDQRNSLWVGTSDRGLYRIRGSDVDHYGSAEGLSSDSVQKIFEDREGNLWVGTSQGLDMFRELPVTSVSEHEGLNQDAVESVAAGRDGTVWIGTSRLQALGPNGISLDAGKGLPGNQTTSVFEDQAGRLWAGMNDRLFVLEGVRFREIRKQNGSALGMVMGITEDSEHNIWVETGGSQGVLVRIADLQIREEFTMPKMPLARKIVADPQRGIWLGLVTGDLARYRDGQITTFPFRDHPNSRVLAITLASDGAILGGTSFGVIGWKNGKQQILTTQNGLPCDYVSAIISDDLGDLWLYSQCGLIEIPNDQMKRWWEHPDSKLSPKVFDTSDGVRPGLGHFNTSAKTPDGRLWFANGTVVQVIDPAHTPKNDLPPPVEIGAVIADRKEYSPGSVIRLPPLTRDVEIDYAAFSYAAPQKVLFRYMLEGYDAGWQEPGTRRQAFYNNLRPKQYHFRVLACNNDGVWNETGASLDFAILPAYYQTGWFRAVCAVLVLALLWGLYQLRLRQLERQFSVGLEARVDERTRIARELHDTLLQSLHGLMFQFQAARNMLPRRPEEAIETLDSAINATEEAIAEGRGAIHDLRSGQVDQADLPELLGNAGQELAHSQSERHPAPAFHLIVEGDRQTLPAVLQDEVYRIACEILRNAFQHAQADRIEAEIRYDSHALRLRIRDDGQGIDPEILQKGGSSGHWGLRGIRERAERIEARLDFWSEAGAGTEVELTVPGKIAYQKPDDRTRFRLFRKAGSHEQRS